MKKILFITSLLFGITTLSYGQQWGVGTEIISDPLWRTGNVGIGMNTAPAHRLDVDGNINTTGVLKINGATFLSAAGINNVFVGTNAGLANTTGRENLFLGPSAGYYNLGGSFNVFIGNQAGYENLEGTHNTFIGNQAGKNYIGTGEGHNVMIGNLTGLNHTSGKHNTFIGTAAGYSNTSGERNVFIGYNAGYNDAGSSDKLYISSSSSSQLLYGDFASGQLGINTTTLEADAALTVGGNASIKGPETTGLTIESGGTNFNSFINFKEGSEYKSHLFWDGSADRLQVKSDADIQLEVGDGKTVFVGTSATPGNLLVNGKINSVELKLEATIAVPDYVFADDYDLPTLKDTENYIKENQHLPEIPSAKEIEKEGIDVGVMNLKLLKKIEELTLYMIDLKKENEQMIKDNEEMKKRMEKLENK